MRLANLLATPRGRIGAFFLLYITEGIPIGFAATAMATQMRRMGLSPAEIGAFVGALYLPWAFKWVAGPVVDVFRSRRWGARRGWILAMQILMVCTLAAAASLDPVLQLGLVTALILLHNSFAAVQDVAIDALAVGSLQPGERGRASGWMFAGANLGQALGGAGALAVSAWLGYAVAVAFVCGCLLLVTLLVVWPMREPNEGQSVQSEAGEGEFGAGRTQAEASAWASIGARLQGFINVTWQTLRNSRPARMGFLVALLPPGCMSLNLALQTNLGVDLGMDDQSLAGISLTTTTLGALGCIIGGRLADGWGRQATLRLAIAGMALPVLALAGALFAWGEPSAGQPSDTRLQPAFVVACTVYGLFNGFMYGSSMPMFMDITRAMVAATQFTAYTALMNLTITISARWQGLSIEALGYANTLLLDVLAGSLILLFLPLIRPDPAPCASARTASGGEDQADGARSRPP